MTVLWEFLVFVVTLLVRGDADDWEEDI